MPSTRNNHKKRKNLLKKFEIETIYKIPGHIALDKVLIWFQDEARFGQRNTTTKIWAEKGTRPRAVQQQQFEYAYIFGAACVQTGQTEALIFPFSNAEAMSQHLSLISAATPDGMHSVVVMDQAPWHQADLANAFKNLTIIHLPPYSPELNPMEQVWQWLRQNEIANRCFKNYDDIVSVVSQGWNSFRNNIDRVKSICFRDWTILTN